jgi:hypothetical protein
MSKASIVSPLQAEPIKCTLVAMQFFSTHLQHNLPGLWVVGFRGLSKVFDLCKGLSRGDNVEAIMLFRGLAHHCAG